MNESPSPLESPGHSRLRLGALVVLLSMILAASIALFTTELGGRIRHDTHALGHETRGWVAAHPVSAPLAFIGAYIVAAILALPVWWLHVVAGYGFGLIGGVVVSQLAAALGAAAAAGLSRWIGGDYFHRRIEPRLDRVRRLDERLGKNGLLLVMAVRLTPILPHALSNYALGLLRVSLLDVAVGTLLGGTPAACIYVALGENRSRLGDWKFWLIVTVITLLVLLPLVLRYLRPAVFKRVGIE